MVNFLEVYVSHVFGPKRVKIRFFCLPNSISFPSRCSPTLETGAVTGSVFIYSLFITTLKGGFTINNLLKEQFRINK